MHDDAPKKSKVMLTSDVARELGVAKETVLQLERNGKLNATRTIGGRRLFDQFDVERLKKERAERNSEK